MTAAPPRLRLRPVEGTPLLPLPAAAPAIGRAVRHRNGAKDRASAASVRVLVLVRVLAVATILSVRRSVLPLRRRKRGAVQRVRRVARRPGVVRLAATTSVLLLADLPSAALRVKRKLPLAAATGVRTPVVPRIGEPRTVLAVPASAATLSTARAVPLIAVPRTVGVTASLTGDGGMGCNITALVGTVVSMDTPIAADTVSAVRIAVSGTIMPLDVDITAIAVWAIISVRAVTAVGATAPIIAIIPPTEAVTVAKRSVEDIRATADAVMAAPSAIAVDAAVSAITAPTTTADVADTAITVLAVGDINNTDAATSPASITGKVAAASLAITP